jgi:1-deoxy-D-xylulose-5-phosphate synthase
MHHLAHAGLLDGGLKFRPMVLPDVFLDQDKPQLQYDHARLNAPHILATALAALGINDRTLRPVRA